MSAQELPDFDVRIIERFVENTYRKAAAVFLGSVVAGVLIGAVFGAMPLTSLGESWPIPREFGFATMILGAVLGGVIGYLIGDTRAFLARLQGQTALAQIHAAKDARLALDALREIQALATRRVSAPQPAPVEPAPVEPAPPPPVQAVAVAPAPVAPAAAAPAPLVAAVPQPVVHVVPDPAPVEPQPEPAPPTVEPVAAPPTLVVAVEQAPPAPPVSS